MFKQLFLLFLAVSTLAGASLSFFSAPTAVSCAIYVNAGDDTQLCDPAGAAQLFGEIGSEVFEFRWEPAAFLDNPTSLTPIASVPNTTTFTLTGFGFDPNAPNLVTNGGFGQGNTAFSSNYAYEADLPGVDDELYQEGEYAVTASPATVHPNFADCSDHDGNGGMMVVNGAGTVENVWCQPISVQPDRHYNFSAWVTSVVSGSPARLQFTVNGTQLGSVFNHSGSNCSWEEFTGTWISNSSTATLCVLNLNTDLSGNDFALDDIRFTESCEATDEVTVSVVELDPQIYGPTMIDCDAADPCVELQVDPGNLGSGISPLYWWWTSDGEIQGLANQSTVTVCQPGRYNLFTEVFLSNGEQCYEEVFYDVTASSPPPPLPQLSGPTNFCPGEYTFSATANDAYLTYNWQLPPGVTPLGPVGGPNLQAVVSDLAAGESLCLTVSNGCNQTAQTCLPLLISSADTIFRDSMVCRIVGPSSFVDTLPAAVGCDTIVVTNLVELGYVTQFDTIQTCVAADTGYFEITLPGTEQECDTLIYLTAEWVLPDTIRDTLLSCLPGEVGSVAAFEPGDAGTCDRLRITTTLLQPPDTILVQQISCLAVDTGHVESLFVDPADGCETLTITTTDYIQPDTLRDTLISCLPGEVGSVVAFEPGDALTCDRVRITTMLLQAPDTILVQQTSCLAVDTGRVESLFVDPADGCRTLTITTTAYIQPDTLRDTLISCLPGEVGSVVAFEPGDALTCDRVRITTTLLQAPDTILVQQISCLAVDTGHVESLFVDPEDGCETLTITTTSYIQPDTLRDTLLSCLPGEVGTVATFEPGDALTCDRVRITTTLLQAPDTILVQQTSCLAVDTGRVESLFVDPADGCQTLTITRTAYIQPDTLRDTLLSCLPGEVGTVATFEPGDALTCDRMRITTTLLQAPDTTDVQLFSCDAGELGVSLTLSEDAEGCPLVIRTTTTLRETGTGFVRRYSCDPAEYGLDTLVVNLGACDSTVVIETYGNGPPQFGVIVNNQDCRGNPGSLVVGEVSGGEGPFRYALNGDTTNDTGLFSGLAPGEYRIEVTDARGCRTQRTTAIGEEVPPVLDIGPDATIVWGDSIFRGLRHDIDFIAASQIEYSDARCAGCEARWYAPLTTTDYRVTVIDSFGCRASDQFRITVERPAGVYVPTAFSPNGDGTNDRIFVQGNAAFVVEISDFYLFDRWGEAIFYHPSPRLNDPADGWDGTYRGRTFNPGVFVYHFRVRYLDGSSRQFSGEVTLLH